MLEDLEGDTQQKDGSIALLIPWGLIYEPNYAKKNKILVSLAYFKKYIGMVCPNIFLALLAGHASFFFF